MIGSLLSRKTQYPGNPSVVSGSETPRGWNNIVTHIEVVTKWPPSSGWQQFHIHFLVSLKVFHRVANKSAIIWTICLIFSGRWQWSASAETGDHNLYAHECSGHCYLVQPNWTLWPSGTGTPRGNTLTQRQNGRLFRQTTFLNAFSCRSLLLISLKVFPWV